MTERAATQFLKRQPTFFEVVLVLGMMLLLYNSCKLILVVCFVAAAIAGVAVAFLPWRGLIVAYYSLLLASIVSVVSPVDLHFVRGAAMSVRFTSVRMTHGLSTSIRAMEAEKGRLENQDYVIYDCDGWPLVAPRWCVLVTTPKSR